MKLQINETERVMMEVAKSLHSLAKEWGMDAHALAHNHEGADYELGQAAAKKMCAGELIEYADSLYKSAVGAL